MLDENRLDDLLVKWGESREQGAELSVDELCIDCPELADEMSRRISHVKTVRRFIDFDDSDDDDFLHLPDVCTVSNHAAETQLPACSRSLDEFAAAVSDSGLMPTDQIQTFRELHPSDDAQSLARQMVEDEKLTRFQASVLLDGRDQPLLLDRYIILDEIGSGGMGAVFKALHRRMDRVVALKILPRSAVDSPAKVKRFRREVQAAAKLEHPNIVTAFDAHESKGIHYLVMSYVNGSDLSQVVRNRGPLPTGKAVACIVQAARGLQHAHEQGICHRDVKPANLLLDKRGTVKILDMGLARIESTDPECDKTLSQELTGAGSMLGTVAYVAPEQAIDAHNADTRSDIYSLGCTLYYLLTGKPVYAERTMMKTIMAHQQSAIPPLGGNRADVPPELEAVYRRMVAKNPDDRYQSMREVISALEALDIEEEESEVTEQIAIGSEAAQETLTLVDTNRDSVQTGPATAHPKRRWRLVAAGGLAALLLAAGIYLKVRTTAGTIIVEIDQPELAGAVVSVDGQKKVTIKTGEGKEPIEVVADEKTHTLRVAKGGFETFTRQFTVKAGGAQTIRVRLVPEKVAKITLTEKAHLVKNYALHLLEDSQVELEFDSLPIEHPVTAEAWLLAQDPNRSPSIAVSPISLHLSPDALAWQTIMFMRAGSPDYRVFTSDKKAELNRWTHIATIWDGQVFRFYVDGRLQRSKDIVKNPKPLPDSVFKGIEGGGMVDEFRISNTARYSKDFTPEKRFEPDVHTLALYHFDEGKGDVLKDSSGNGHHGKIVGAKWVNADSTPIKDDDPPLAIAPFNAKEAKAHQSAWAKYLGLPVEKEVDLPGGAKISFMLIPPGEFQMGSTKEEQTRVLESSAFQDKSTYSIETIPTEGPQHRVRITQPFYLAKHEVTQAQWQSMTGNNPSIDKAKPDNPVTMVSWDDVRSLLETLNKQDSLTEIKFALPTEAQWEYACRAGTTSPWYFGDDAASLHDHGSFKSNTRHVPSPVAQWRPNPLGLYDMHGNVWEWCADWFGANFYTESPVDDPVGRRSKGSRRVIKGGGFIWGGSAWHCRSAMRTGWPPEKAYNNLGFRLAMTIDTEKLKAAQSPLNNPSRSKNSSAPSTTESSPPLPSTWKPGPKENVISGIIPRPATLPGIRSWQLFTDQPIEWLVDFSESGPVIRPPNGEQFATISEKNVRVYDTNSRSLIQVLPHDGEFGAYCLAYSHDGKLLAAAYTDGTIRVWDAHTWEVRKEIREEGRRFIHVSWSPDNLHLATGSHWTTPAVQWWSVSNGKEQWKTPGSGPVTSTAWSPDGKWFAASSEGWFRIWSIKDDMKEVLNVSKFSNHINWSNDGKHVSVILDRQLTILETGSWDVIADRVSAATTGLRWEAMGQRIYFTHDNVLSSYSLFDKQVERIGYNPSSRNFVALHPKGDMLLTQAVEGPLSYWTQDSKEKNKWMKTTGPVVDRCEQLASTADGKWIIARHPQSAKIQVWDWAGRRHREHSSTSRFAINSEQVLAFAEKDGRIHQAHLDDTASLPPLISHTGPVTLLEYQPHGDELLSAGQDGTVRRFDSRAGDVLQVIRQEQPTPIGQISWRPDGQGFAVLSGTGKDARIVTYSAGGEALLTIEPPTDDFVRSFRWHPDGKSLAVTLNKTVQFRTATKGEITATTDEHIKGIVAAAWHPRGKLLATSGGFQDRVVRFWQENGLAAGEMNAGGGWVENMKWSPDGKWLAVRGDSTGRHIWIWDHAKRAPGPVFEHLGGVVRICWHPDSKRLASTAGDGTMRIWNVESGEQEQITINLPESQYVTFDAAGNVIHGDKQTIEKSFKYFVEHADGKRELLKPSEFYRLTTSK